MRVNSFTFPLLLVLYEISTYLSNDMYLPALPEMMTQLSLTAQQVQLTLTVWFIGMACTPLIFGAMSDRYGRRPILLIGGFIFTIASAGCALSNTISLLLSARFVQGCVIPSMMVAGYASIHELYDHKEAIRILAIMSSITVLAPAFGPLVGAFVLYVGNWRDIFWFITLGSAITIACLYFKMPETHAIEKREPLNLRNLFGSYWRVLTNKLYMLRLATLGSLFAGFIVLITVSPFLIIQTFHYSVIDFGLFQAFIFIFYIIGNHNVDYLMEKFGITKLIRMGLLLIFIGGILASVTALLFPHTLYPFVGAMTIYSIGSSFCFAPINRLVIEASDEPMGIRVALFTVILMLVLAFTSGLASFIFNGTIFSLAIITTIGALLACFIASLID